MPFLSRVRIVTRYWYGKSVCLPVCNTLTLSKWLYISSDFLNSLVCPSFYFFAQTTLQNSDGNTISGDGKYRSTKKNLRFLPMLSPRIRYKTGPYKYYGSLIVSHSYQIKPCHIWLHWMTWKDWSERPNSGDGCMPIAFDQQQSNSAWKPTRGGSCAQPKGWHLVLLILGPLRMPMNFYLQLPNSAW